MLKILTILVFSVSLLISGEIAIVKKMSGDVTLKRDKKIEKVSIGMELKEGDVLMTKQNSSVGFIFQDGSVLSLGENSILTINKYLFKPVKNKFSFDVKMYKGLATFESGKIGKLAPKSVKFRVPDGIIGIRGTKFFVEVK